MSGPTAHNQLAPVLRQLNLTGMLDTLDARLAEARAGTLGHVDFLQTLCEDELPDATPPRSPAGSGPLICPAPPPWKASTTTSTPTCPSPRSGTSPAWSSSPPENRSVSTGPSVSAKPTSRSDWPTNLRRGHDVLFLTTSQLLAELGGGHANGSFPARLHRLAKPALLVLDDFAMRNFGPTQADDFYELICERVGHPGRSLIVTSNRSPGDWYPLFPNPVVGESVLDRLLNSSHHLLLDGKSYRPNRRPGRHKPT